MSQEAGSGGLIFLKGKYTLLIPFFNVQGGALLICDSCQFKRVVFGKLFLQKLY
jgi:hypothetical protein